MANYFNTLPLRLQLAQLGTCEFMDSSEFADGVKKLIGKKIVIIGCGAQGLNQGLEYARLGTGCFLYFTCRSDQRTTSVVQKCNGQRIQSGNLRRNDPNC